MSTKAGQAHATDLDARAAVIKAALINKQEKGLRYRTSGTPTILLLDSDDIGLMDPGYFARAFLAAAGATRHDGYDDIFLLDSTERRPWLYPLQLRGNSDVPPNLLELFIHAQYQRDYVA